MAGDGGHRRPARAARLTTRPALARPPEIQGATADEDDPDLRPVVEERRHLLPGHRDLLRRRRRRGRRHRRPHRAHRLPRPARRHLPVAHAVLPDAGPRRRLRRHRLLRGGPPAGHPRRRRRAHPHRQGPRHAGDRRPAHQPHLERAPVVPGRPDQQGQPLPRLLRLALGPAAGHLRPGDLPRQGGLHLGARRAHRRVVPAPLLRPPAGPQHRQPQGARRDLEDDRLLAPARPRRLPGGRGAVLPLRRRAQPGGPAGRRPAHVPAPDARLPRPPARRRRSCWARSTCPTRSSGSTSAPTAATSCT